MNQGRRNEDTGRRTEDRIEKRRRRDEKRKRKELRRLRRVARASFPNTSRNDEEGAGDSEAEREKEEASEHKLADSGIFVWKKKNEQLRKRGVRLTVEDELARKREIESDLEKSKLRRAERDAERARWEAEQAEMKREREQSANADWYRAEEAFMGKQHLLRQAIRLKEGRGTHLDQLARNMRLDLCALNSDTRTPAEYLEDKVRQGTLSATDLEMMLEGIDSELDSLADFAPENDTAVFNHTARLEWWNSISEFLKALVRYMRERTSFVGSSSSNVHSSVQKDVDKLLYGKSKVELEILEQDLSDKLANGNGHGAFGEVDFWAAAIRSVRCELARLKLGELNSKFNAERTRLRMLNPSSIPNTTRRRNDNGNRDIKVDLVQAERSKGMAEGEENFVEEVDVAVNDNERRGKEYAWNDKYRPRKPRYYNRVHTGYDWTKYNRTHYDQNNPPPKTVQGYKFNIFFPDLMDKSITPTFRITKTDNPDVAIITFTSGKPYLDIAFKIVNRPWEQSHRKGYRCAFDRGILQLWFTFQRYRYRR